MICESELNDKIAHHEDKISELRTYIGGMRETLLQYEKRLHVLRQIRETELYAGGKNAI